MRGQHFCWGDIDFISKSAGRHGSSVGAVGCIHHDPNRTPKDTYHELKVEPIKPNRQVAYDI